MFSSNNIQKHLEFGKHPVRNNIIPWYFVFTYLLQIIVCNFIFVDNCFGCARFAESSYLFRNSKSENTYNPYANKIRDQTA